MSGKSGKSVNSNREWLYFNVTDGRNCTREDYKDWSPSSNGYEECLMGKKTVYERRRTHSLCFNGREYDRKISEENCSCTIQDYEWYVIKKVCNLCRTFWIFNFYGFIRIYHGYIDYFVIRNKDLYGFIGTQHSNINLSKSVLIRINL